MSSATDFPGGKSAAKLKTNETQTTMINIVNLYALLYKLHVEYDSQHTFSKVTVTENDQDINSKVIRGLELR